LKALTAVMKIQAVTHEDQARYGNSDACSRETQRA
jgi:hypothetical protein